MHDMLKFLIACSVTLKWAKVSCKRVLLVGWFGLVALCYNFTVYANVLSPVWFVRSFARLFVCLFICFFLSLLV